MKSLVKTFAITLFALLLAASPQLVAQTTNKAPAEKKSSEKKESPEKKQSPIPFHGNIVTLDKNARTLTIGKRTFLVTSETKIFKADKPAIFTDGVVGEYVTGSYKKMDDGKLVAHSVYFGGKSKATSSEKKKDTTSKDSSGK